VSQLSVNTITNAAGGNTAQINGMTPTADSLQGFRNRILNGGMVIDQRNAGAAVTAPSGGFPVDRFNLGNSTDGVTSSQQDSSAPEGFTTSLKVTTTTIDTSITTTQLCALVQRIEGLNTADFGWGTASAKPVTLSFWVRSSLTGTFGGSLRNSAANRSYPFSYSISSANTWEYKTITVPGDTAGTWLTTNGVGINVFFGLGAGPDVSGTAGAWNSNNNVSVTGAVSVIGTLDATWYITGVQLEAGSVATPFERRPFGVEELLCLRYTQVLSGPANTRLFTSGNTTGTSCFATTTLKARMRTTPSITTSAMSNFNLESLASIGYTPTSISFNAGFNDTVTVQVIVGSTISGPGANLTCANASAQIILSAEL
jgi:hypothetical protein